MTEKIKGGSVVSSYIMHICISDIIRRKHKLSEKYLYGCILPDLQKELGIDREKTHFTKRIEKEGSIRFLPQIDIATNELKDKLDKEVYLGYISHLIEDYIWFNKYIPKYTIKLNENEVLYLKDNTIHSLVEYRNNVYSDYRYFAKYVINKCEIDLTETLNAMKCILNSKEKILLLQNTNINVEILSGAILISKESIDQYIKECVSEVDKFVSNMLNNTDKIECKCC